MRSYIKNNVHVSASWKYRWKYSLFGMKYADNLIKSSLKSIGIMKVVGLNKFYAGTALGEMHKYRDGIIRRETEEKAVKEVYILTPTKTVQAETMRYFQEDFHEKYRMGAIQLEPGGVSEDFEDKILAIVKSMWS